MLKSPSNMLHQLVEECQELSLNLPSSKPLEARLLALTEGLKDDASLKAIFQDMLLKPNSGYRTQMILEEEDCKIMLVVLLEGAEVPLHNHPNQNGFIYCCQGEVLVDGFDEISSTAKPAVIEQVVQSKVSPGEHAFLSPKSANIHRLKAISTVCLIDVFIPPLKEEDRDLCRGYRITESGLKKNQFFADII